MKRVYADNIVVCTLLHPIISNLFNSDETILNKIHIILCL